MVALLYLLLGVCQTTVNMEEAVPSLGPPSIVTAVTQATLAPPAITVSKSVVSIIEWAESQESDCLHDVVNMGKALVIHSFNMRFLR